MEKQLEVVCFRSVQPKQQSVNTGYGGDSSVAKSLSDSCDPMDCSSWLVISKACFSQIKNTGVRKLDLDKLVN